VVLSFIQNQALHIVRTIGQAFDVCHKANPKPQFKRPEKTDENEKSPNETNIDDAIEKASEKAVKEGSGEPVSPGSTDLDVAVAATQKEEQPAKAVQPDEAKDLMHFNPDELNIPNGTSDNNLDPLFRGVNAQVSSRARTDDNREVYSDNKS